MPRGTRVDICTSALIHNVSVVRRLAPAAQIVAMIKANGYGCGVERVLPELSDAVDKLGVATVHEAAAIARLGIRTPCVIFQGVFDASEWEQVAAHNWEVVIHNFHELAGLCQRSVSRPVKVWIKINTGMNRLGFRPQEVPEVLTTLQACAWVDPAWVFMMHFANADLPAHPLNTQQWQQFQAVLPKDKPYATSVANSAAILAAPTLQATWVRPGLMLYGISPFLHEHGAQHGLQPVQRFYSTVMQIFSMDVGEAIGYGSTWIASQPTRVAVVAAGYGDGYPRCVKPGTCVVIQGQRVPLIGRVSMETLTVDVTALPRLSIGEQVELWGVALPIEEVAAAAGTIPYELMVKVRPRG